MNLRPASIVAIAVLSTGRPSAGAASTHPMSGTVVDSGYRWLRVRVVACAPARLPCPALGESVSIDVAARLERRAESLRRGDFVTLECRDGRNHVVIAIDGDAGRARTRSRVARAMLAVASSLIALVEARR